MRVDAFDFELPASLIANRPCTPRDLARLMHVTARSIDDTAVRELPGFLRSGDIMVFNDTRVIPARLLGHREAVAIELLLHKRVTPDTWEGFARPAKRLKPGHRIDFSKGFSAEVLSREGPIATVRFNQSGPSLMAALEAFGHIPLPPYIRRSDDARDRADYQTIYAAKDGAVAAPTAGLHFTPDLFSALDEVGVLRVNVTLHVGAGTFLPVTAEDTSEHKMHAEWGEIDEKTADDINSARARGGRIIAVGTTSLRLLETAADENGIVCPFTGETSLFITPGYQFKAADVLMTNFHLPRSTLFMLVCAFAGSHRMKSAYEHAITTGYRFYSYGDACLLQRDPEQ